MAQILDGNRVRDEIKSELKPRVEAMAAAGRPPGLAVVLAGNNPASGIYGRNKIKACHDLGIYSESITPPDTVSTEEMLEVVRGLNGRADIDGILVQLPLPRQGDTKGILLAVGASKGGDGVHPWPVGREGDILVAAVGRAAWITGEYIKPGATVIDVGTNRIEDRDEAARIFRNSADRMGVFDKRGSVLVGDVHPLDVAEIAGAYTPVPGGVGPLTIAMLMANTVAAAERRPGIC